MARQVIEETAPVQSHDRLTGVKQRGQQAPPNEACAAGQRNLVFAHQMIDGLLDQKFTPKNSSSFSAM
jgi:hypothetical protein